MAGLSAMSATPTSPYAMPRRGARSTPLPHDWTNCHAVDELVATRVRSAPVEPDDGPAGIADGLRALSINVGQLDRRTDVFGARSCAPHEKIAVAARIALALAGLPLQGQPCKRWRLDRDTDVVVRSTVCGVGPLVCKPHVGPVRCDYGAGAVLGQPIVHNGQPVEIGPSPRRPSYGSRVGVGYGCRVPVLFLEQRQYGVMVRGKHPKIHVL